MSELKTRPTTADPNAYLEAIDDPQRRADAQTLLGMMSEVSACEPINWGGAMLGFGRYRYRYDSGHSGEWMRIGFAVRKANLSLYLLPSVDAHAELLARLGKHKTGKGCLYIKRLADVDPDVLRQLIAAAWAEMQARYPD